MPPRGVLQFPARYKNHSMVDEPAYIRRFKAFTRGELTIADLPRLEDEVYGINERASAIIFGSIVENSLTALLKNSLRQEMNRNQRKRLFDERGPLGTFSAKIITAYAFELIGPATFNDLDIIRIVRNEFAHSRKHFGFDSSELADVCAHLQTPDFPGAFMEFSSLERATAQLNANLKDARTRYRTACHTLSSRLLKSARMRRKNVL